MNIYGWVRKTGGVSWYRVQEPLRGLAQWGHTTSFGPDLNFGMLPEYDAVITSVHGEEEASSGWEAMARLPGRPLMVYDIDDDVWNFRAGLHQYEYWQSETLLRNVQSCIACADVVVTPSPVLAEIVSPLNRNVHVYGNYVPKWITEVMVSPPQEFTVGYQGGDTHTYDIAEVGPELMRFILRHPDTRMRIWGSKAYEGPAADRVSVTPWERDLRRYYLSLRMSVGLAPLERTPFNLAKSAIKAVEYAALGIPTIATNTITYAETVDNGVTGLLVNKGQWYDALHTLKNDFFARSLMAANARTRAAKWTTEHNVRRYGDILDRGLHG